MARSIADLAGVDQIQPPHLAEAIWPTSNTSGGSPLGEALERFSQGCPSDHDLVLLEGHASWSNRFDELRENVAPRARVSFVKHPAPASRRHKNRV
jgi:hypothetical protein